MRGPGICRGRAAVWYGFIGNRRTGSGGRSLAEHVSLAAHARSCISCIVRDSDPGLKNYLAMQEQMLL